MAQCSVCHQEIKGNIDPAKIIPCGRCVQILLAASHENKIEFRDSLMKKGDFEGARTVESFIVEEEVNEGESGRKFKDRSANLRKKFGGGIGYLKVNPLRPQKKRSSLDQSGG
jgi:hypothetical protein